MKATVLNMQAYPTGFTPPAGPIPTTCRSAPLDFGAPTQDPLPGPDPNAPEPGHVIDLSIVDATCPYVTLILSNGFPNSVARDIHFKASFTSLAKIQSGLISMPSGWSSEAEKVATDADGNAYVSGFYGGSPSKGFLRKYSPSGALVWSVDRPNGDLDSLTVVGSSIFVSGSEGFSISGRTVYAAKYDLNGTLQWAQDPLPAPLVNGVATADATAGDGIYLACAGIPSAGTGPYLAVVTAAGVIHQLNLNGSYVQIGRIRSTPSRSQFYAPLRTSYGGNDVITRYNADLSRDNSFPGISGKVWDYSVDPSTGDLYVVFTGQYGTVNKYSSDGRLVWSSNLTAAIGLQLDGDTSIQAIGSRVYVAGYTYPGGQMIAALAEISAETGTLIADQTWGADSTFSLDVYGVAANQSGSIWVVGATYGPTFDGLTVPPDTGDDGFFTRLVASP